MIEVGVTGIGLLGPGLADWAFGQALLRDPPAWRSVPTQVPAGLRLPPTERRRAGALVKASVEVAGQALAMAGLDAAGLATVFSSSTADPLNCHLLCEALATSERQVSPTRFTNSVHNAAAGYWHIAVASRAPSTSLAAFDASFSAALLEAAVQCASGAAPVLLVACDLPYPEPLHTVRPVPDLFATALVLSPAGTGRRVTVQPGDEAGDSGCAVAGLEALRVSIPAARALPLLVALSRNAAARIGIDGPPGLGLQIGLAAA